MFRAGTKYLQELLQEQTVWSVLLYHILAEGLGKKKSKPNLASLISVRFLLHWIIPSKLLHTDLLCLTKWACAMPNDVILLHSQLPSTGKDLNLHSQTQAAAPADAAM